MYRSARALYDCNAEDSLELSFKKDEILYNGRNGLASSIAIY